jgi:hypothetical protein
MAIESFYLYYGTAFHSLLQSLKQFMNYESYCTYGLVLILNICRSIYDILAKSSHRSDNSLVREELSSDTPCQEMHDTSTLILAKEKKNLIKKENDIRNHTLHRDFTLLTLNRENQHSFERSSLLFSYSI